MKYIMVKITGEELDQFVPIIFPNSLVHSEIAKSIKRMIMWDRREGGVTIVSAGDYCIMNRTCSGRSETLGLESRGMVDESIINMNDYHNGLV